LLEAFDAARQRLASAEAQEKQASSSGQPEDVAAALEAVAGGLRHEKAASVKVPLLGVVICAEVLP